MEFQEKLLLRFTDLYILSIYKIIFASSKLNGAQNIYEFESEVAPRVCFLWFMKIWNLSNIFLWITTKATPDSTSDSTLQEIHDPAENQPNSQILFHNKLLKSWLRYF